MTLENFDLRISQQLIDGVAAAVRALLAGQEKIDLEKPYGDFSVTLLKPENEKLIFSIYSTEKLGIQGESRQVYVICRDVLGAKE